MSAAAISPDCDLTGAAPRADSLFGRGHAAVTFGIVASVLLTAFEGLAVFTAMPVAVTAVHGMAYLSLTFTAYTTASLLGMVLSGVRSDARGPRVPFLGGISIFGAGLLVSGTATTMAQLVGGRAVQGLGGGMVAVSLYVVVGRAYPDALRPKAFALMAALWVLPSVVGPLVAGTLTENLSWRWVFLGVALLVPVPIVALVGPLRGMVGPAVAPDADADAEADADTDAAPGPAAAAPNAGRRRLTAATLAAVGSGLLQFASQDLTWIALGLGLIAVALLVPSVPRLLPPGTLRAGRGLPAVILMHGILAGAFFGSENYITAMLENERGVSPTVAGLTLTGVTLSWAAAAAATSRDKLRLSREAMTRLGSVVAVASIAVTGSAVLLPFPAAVVTLGMVVGGFGMGLVFPSLNLLLLRLSPPREQGVNSSSLQLADCFGGIVVTGSTGAVFHALHGANGTNSGLYVVMFAMMAAAAVAAAVIAPRTGAGVAS